MFLGNSFISIHSKITWLQLLIRWIKVSLCNLQKKHKGKGVFPKRNSILLRYNTLLSILYWKTQQLLLLLISLGRRYINFQSKFESGNKELKYCCEVSMLVLLEINIEYNSFEVNFSKLISKLFLIKWWSRYTTQVSVPFSLSICFYFLGIPCKICNYRWVEILIWCNSSL